MLIQFRVENHRSLRDEQALSLAASDKAGSYVFHVDGLGEDLAPVAAVYGANASGKSNVLGALGFLHSAILHSQRLWEIEGTPQQPFLLSDKAQKPSLYEVDVVVGGVRFRYGFVLGAARVEEEWLFAWPHGRRAMWFEREGDHFEFGKTLHGENEVIRGLTRPNSLFLSAAAQNNHPALVPLARYFLTWAFSLSRSWGSPAKVSRLLALKLMDSELTGDREAILRLLREADTGIVDAKVEITGGSARSRSSLSDVQFRHRAADDRHAWLPLSAESAGTIALLDLAPSVVQTLRQGGLLCVDELEASLHPSLSLRIVEMFNDPKQNPHRAQLVFATHDTNLLGTLMGTPALRRDQIWFTEKDDAGATKLYPLTDFHPRKEENLERGYLQGRYGAVPFLGELVEPAAGEPGHGDAAPADSADGEPR